MTTTNDSMDTSPMIGVHEADGLAREMIATSRRMPAQTNRKGRRAKAEPEARILMQPIFTTPPAQTKRRKAKAKTPENGQDKNAAQETHAVPEISEGHSNYDNRSMNALAGECRMENEAHRLDALPYPIIRELWRQRYAWVKARTALTLAGQARCRGFADGDKKEGSRLWKAYLKGEEIDSFLALTLQPFKLAVDTFNDQITPVEKTLTTLVKQLPCYPYLKSTRGIGDIFIAGIFGECGGPITKSHSVSALWKFFGVAVFEGKRQAYSKDATENKRQAYSSRRRSLIAQIESGFIMAGNEQYRAIYDERKAYELARDVPKGHASNRAKRYMGKRFLRELYKHARTVEVGQSLYANQTPHVSLQTDLNGHIWDENHICDAVQDSGHYTYDDHVTHAAVTISGSA